MSTGPTERIRLAASSRLSLPPTPADARYGMSHRESPNQTSCADTTRADIGQGHTAHPSRPLGRPPPRTRASPSITGPLHIGTTSRTIGDVATDVFDWIETWYNRRRRHTSLGMLSPLEYEAQHYDRIALTNP